MERVVETTAGFSEGNGLDFAGIDIGHAASDFFVPSGFDGGIVGFVKALDKGASEISALRHGERKGLFQEFRCFLSYGLILANRVDSSKLKVGGRGVCLSVILDPCGDGSGERREEERRQRL